MPDTAAPAPPTIFTIGHSNVTLNDFLDRLRAAGVATIVDVRSVPFSQYTPHFNRERLERSLREAGLGYVYAGETLGGRPTDPTCYKNGEVPDGKAGYLHLVDYAAVATRPWYLAGIASLIETASSSPTAVMCSEEDPARCHRTHLIAATLLARGIPVHHIRRDGAITAATPPPEPTTQLCLL